MRSLILSVLFLTALVRGLSQPAANPESNVPKEPSAILDAAKPLYDFNSPALKPWHLKATYQLYDVKGNPTEQGAWEYWWASPKVHRSDWTRAGAETTKWVTADGAVYSKETGKPLRYFERTIEEILLSPLPQRGFLESGKIKLDLRMLPSDKPEFACVFATQQWSKLGTPGFMPLADKYCFEPATMALRVAYSHQLMRQYDQLVVTQGHYLARQVMVKYGEETVFSVAVNAIEELKPADTVFSPPADATLERSARISESKDQSNTVMGSLVKTTEPVYPQISKMNHEQGVVVLAATIGTDGRIHDLEVLASPSSLLAESAAEAVKKWEYKPCLLNGQPIEAQILLNIIFNLGKHP